MAGISADRLRAAGGDDVVGLRIVRRMGISGIVQVAVAVALLLNVYLTIATLRPDLINPTIVGSDPYNYLAAGERLNAGHPMYHLSPGDRPVPQLPPPHSDAALLSPPLLGVVWRPLALMGDLGMYVWLIAGVVALGGIAFWMILNGSLRRNALILVVTPCIALCMWSGNVNAFIVSLLVGVWAAHRSGRPELAGALLAVAAALKLTPVYLAWWFIVRRDWPALKGFVAAGLGLAAISLVFGGIQNHFDYINVVRTTSSNGESPWSVPGFLEGFGIDHSLAVMAMYGWTVLGGLTMWLLRRRPRASFATGVLTVLYSSPVVLLGNLALLVAATAPYPGRRAALVAKADG